MAYSINQHHKNFISFVFSKTILMEKLEKISCGIVLKRVGAAKLKTFLIYQSIYENVYTKTQPNTLSFVI